MANILFVFFLQQIRNLSKDELKGEKMLSEALRVIQKHATSNTQASALLNRYLHKVMDDKKRERSSSRGSPFKNKIPNNHNRLSTSFAEGLRKRQPRLAENGGANAGNLTFSHH